MTTRKASPKPAPKPRARRAKKNLGGRPTYVPTDKDRSFVRAMIIAGCTQERVAEVMEIAPKTLRKHFRKELDFSNDITNAGFVSNLIRQALKDDFRAIPACMFLTKTRLGWRDRSALEVTGADGGPIQFDASNLTDEQLASLANVLPALAGAAGRDAGGGED